MMNLLTPMSTAVGLEHLDAKTIFRHPHGSFELSMGSLEMQKIAHDAYRKCPRHTVKNVDHAVEDLYDGETGCFCCWKRKIYAVLFNGQPRLTDHRFHQRPEDLLLSPMWILFMCRVL
jgi:hypothetical protein